jgi:hypothetical protein
MRCRVCRRAIGRSVPPSITMPLFDFYIMVDWSGGARRRGVLKPLLFFGGLYLLSIVTPNSQFIVGMKCAGLPDVPRCEQLAREGWTRGQIHQAYGCCRLRAAPLAAARHEAECELDRIRPNHQRLV